MMSRTGLTCCLTIALAGFCALVVTGAALAKDQDVPAGIAKQGSIPGEGKHKGWDKDKHKGWQADKTKRWESDKVRSARSARHHQEREDMSKRHEAALKALGEKGARKPGMDLEEQKRMLIQEQEVEKAQLEKKQALAEKQ